MPRRPRGPRFPFDFPIRERTKRLVVIQQEEARKAKMNPPTPVDNRSRNAANSLNGHLEDFAITPRRRSGQDRRAPVVLTRELIESYFTMPLSAASKDLGLCATAIKKVCRKMGISKWPFRDRLLAQKHEEAEAQAAWENNSMDAGDENELWEADDFLSGSCDENEPQEVVSVGDNVAPVSLTLPSAEHKAAAANPDAKLPPLLRDADVPAAGPSSGDSDHYANSIADTMSPHDTTSCGEEDGDVHDCLWADDVPANAPPAPMAAIESTPKTLMSPKGVIVDAEESILDFSTIGQDIGTFNDIDTIDSVMWI